ncbi:hypothetical protein [Methylobacterium nodulans]|uniref:Uncharacterized protein n=1 Tax=Methylobacterium nodulans (strain LMG 21967 / CNCM I-2342 / ORS 2060) TaxID=460265 RepID=B8IAH7_METNO|nr:hypothetical protein [Methylobacterium nodulans]ACL61022.1 hypothetical protein Mnod_6215 [Methylobacterium nodulans ORS 2060]
MEVFQAMWRMLSGRAAQRAAEQEQVSRALAMQRAETAEKVRSIEAQAAQMQGADHAMLELLGRTIERASRAKKGTH